MSVQLAIPDERPDLDEKLPRAVHDAMVAAELGQPGAPAAPVALKMSDNPQFRDPPGACKLTQTAAARGNQADAVEIATCGGG